MSKVGGKLGGVLRVEAFHGGYLKGLSARSFSVCYDYVESLNGTGEFRCLWGGNRAFLSRPCVATFFRSRVI